MYLELSKGCFEPIYVCPPPIDVDASWLPDAEYAESGVQVEIKLQTTTTIDHQNPDAMHYIH